MMNADVPPDRFAKVVALNTSFGINGIYCLPVLSIGKPGMFIPFKKSTTNLAAFVLPLDTGILTSPTGITVLPPLKIYTNVLIATVSLVDAVKLITLPPFAPAVYIVVPLVLLPSVPIVVPVRTATPAFGTFATFIIAEFGKAMILKIK